MIKTILIIIILNFITCLIVRAMQGGRFVYNKNIYPDYNGKMLLIAGIMDQPEKVYKCINMPYGCSGYLNYSLLGYNPKNSGVQLSALTKSKDYIIGTGVGCKSIIFSHHPENKRALINPMTHSIVLEPRFQIFIEYVVPVLRFIAFLLGWISVIPLIRTKKGSWCSIALLLDQLYWTYYDDPHFDDIGQTVNTKIICSNNKYVMNDIIKSIYIGANFENVSVSSTDLGIGLMSMHYDKAINDFF